MHSDPTAPLLGCDSAGQPASSLTGADIAFAFEVVFAPVTLSSG